MSELTPEQAAELTETWAKFKRSMETMGLGVTIQIGDEPPVVVTEPRVEQDDS